MASSSSTSFSRFSEDTDIWNSLKQAIASSSGFRRWEAERGDQLLQDLNLDQRVRRYLRETLETLAY